MSVQMICLNCRECTVSCTQPTHVISQSLVFREQSIDRAEVVALLQVCRLAERDVHVDSTYALHFVNHLPSPGHRSKPPKTDFDLCEWTGVWCKPPNAICHKVKSHADFLSSRPEHARHLLGNSAADHAAKSARVPLLLDLLEDISVRHSVHKTMLGSYLRYQIACARHVTEARQAQQAAAPPEASTQLEAPEAFRQWAALSPTNVVQLAYPQLEKTWLVYAPWPPWFTVTVWRWCSGLRWQPPDAEVHDLAGVTFLELLAHYVVTMHQCPPLIGPGGKQADLSIASPQGRLQPFAVKDVVITLSAAIRYFGFLGQSSCMEPHTNVYGVFPPLVVMHRGEDLFLVRCLTTNVRHMISWYSWFMDRTRQRHSEHA